MASATDQLNRPLGVLRLSLTARCNLACPYCLPDGAEPPGLLTLSQRLSLIEAAVALGARSLRLTGGEPLLHSGLEQLIRAVQPLHTRSADGLGLREIALTSNGTLLSAERARALRTAGLDRITLSLDGTTGAALARERGLELRLIEFMDVGNRNGWHPAAVLSAAAMVERIGARWPLEPLGRTAHGTASRWRYRDRSPGAGGAHLAVVASVSAPFCGDCNRLRVTADGIAYTCLFAATGSGLDLRPWLQPNCPAEGLGEAIASLWKERADRWSEERQEAWALGGPGVPATAPAHAEMAYLGG